MASDATKIRSAARSGNIGRVRELLDAGISPDVTTKDNSTALMAAAKTNRIGICKLLIERGAELEITTKHGQTKYKQKHGLTALTYAVSEGMYETAQYLLECGANPNVKSVRKHLFPILCYPAASGNKDFYDLLLFHGATIFEQHSLHLQAAVYGGNIDIFANVLARLESILSDHHSSTTIQIVKMRALLQACMHGATRHAMIDILLNDGDVDLNPTQRHNFFERFVASHKKYGRPFDMRSTALKVAAEFGHAETIRFLVDRGALVDYGGPDDCRWRPLFYAARHENLAAVRALLDCGANIEAKDGEGLTVVVHAAGREGSTIRNDIMRLLLQRGARINFGSIAITIAQKQENSCFAGYIKSITHLGVTPLSRAGYFQNLEMVQMLLDNGAIVDCVPPNLAITALHTSARGRGGHNDPRVLDVLHLLLDKGADINNRDHMGHTALFHCFYKSNYSAIRNQVFDLLLARGADPSVLAEFNIPQDHPGYTYNAYILKILRDSGRSWTTGPRGNLRLMPPYIKRCAATAFLALRHSAILPRDVINTILSHCKVQCLPP
eukprot:UC1_evm1s1994